MPPSSRHPEARLRPLEPGEPSQVRLVRLAHMMIRSRVNSRSVGDGPIVADKPARPAHVEDVAGARRVTRGRLRMTVDTQCPPVRPPPMRSIDPHTLKSMLADGGELALVDVREELIFSQRHLLWARSIPLSRLELNFTRLVPRLSTRIVLCDDDDGLAERATRILSTGGYTDIARLAGGVTAWGNAGFEFFSGVNVASKAFGEFIEHACGTPSIGASELDAMMRGGADMVVLDSRPLDEYRRVSIPTATNVPGAELVLRLHDLAPSPATTVVVNCAGRTRSIIGAQSLINAGVPNKLVALRNGTMGWSLAGLTCDSGKDKRAGAVSAQGLAAAKAAAEHVARRFGVERIDHPTLARWHAEGNERTLYLFDVRDPTEYAAGHLTGAISAPGGQLVQATVQYFGTPGGRAGLFAGGDAH